MSPADGNLRPESPGHAIPSEDQVDGLHRELARLRTELAEARAALRTVHASRMAEANECLVTAALHAEKVAEAAVIRLDLLTRTSQRDALTGIPNRALMLDRLEHAIAMGRRHGNLVAVLFVDLDDFKQINDTRGHAVGDEVVKHVAQRLQSVVRESDTVSRHGGDEFLVLLAEVAQRSDAALIAAKMLAALAAPLGVSDQFLQLSASVGIAVFPLDGDNTTILIGKADTAMYRSKRSAPGGYAFYGEDQADHLPLPPQRNEMPPIIIHGTSTARPARRRSGSRI